VNSRVRRILSLIVYGAGLCAVVSGIFGLGYWSRGLGFDSDKRSLAKQVDDLSLQRHDLETKVRGLADENQRLKIAVAETSKASEEKWEARLALTKTEGQKERLQSVAESLTSKNNDLRETVGDLNQRVREGDQARAALAKSEGERGKLLAANQVLQHKNEELTKAVAKFDQRVNENDQRSAVMKALESLERQNAEVEETIRMNLSNLRNLKQGAGAAKAMCATCKEKGRCPQEQIIYTCREAASSEEQASQLEKETEWLQGRHKSISSELTTMRARL
jgi:chromosome segregation ATPase